MNDRYIKLLCLLFFHSNFVYLDDGSGVGRIIQAICLGVVIIMLLLKGKLKLQLRFKVINVFVVAYCVALLFISYFSKEINYNVLDRLCLGSVSNDLRLSSYTLGIMLSITIYIGFVIVEYLSEINKTTILFQVFYKTTLFYIIISDVQLLTIGEFLGTEGYLVGNKFTLSYMHLFCYVLFKITETYNSKRSKIIDRILILLTFAISILSECTTALLGFWGLVLILHMRDSKYGAFLYKGMTYVVALSLGVLFMFFYSYVLDISFVQYIIVDVLHEDLTLTGRTGIYDLMLSVIPARPLWGFGVGNSHWVLAYLFGIANAQNAVVNLYIEEGIIGMILYFLVFISVFKFSKRNIQKEFTYPLLSYIFIFFFMGLVEITIDNNLLIIMSLLLAYNYKPIKIKTICQK